MAGLAVLVNEAGLRRILCMVGVWGCDRSELETVSVYVCLLFRCVMTVRLHVEERVA